MGGQTIPSCENVQFQDSMKYNKKIRAINLSHLVKLEVLIKEDKTVSLKHHSMNTTEVMQIHFFI